MAKLWIMSDLHLDTVPHPEAFKPATPEFDVLVCPGDVWDGDIGRTFQTLRGLAGDKPVVATLGNHEHWNAVLEEDLEIVGHFARRYDVTLLQEGVVAEVAGCRFVGCTLWGDFLVYPAADERAETHEQVEVRHRGGSHLITVGDAMRLNGKAKAWLSKAVLGADRSLPLVVVTHHAPHPDCMPQRWKGGWAHGASTSNLSVLTDAGVAALWVHGHIHASCDMVRPGGTRIVCNPAGDRFSNPAFRDDLVLEVVGAAKR